MTNLIECFNELATDLEHNHTRTDNTDIQSITRDIVLELDDSFLLLDVTFDLVMYKGALGSICITRMLSGEVVVNLDQADKDRVFTQLFDLMRNR